jgi:DNA-directed RNA polymerase subunit RPC12/RpoP
MLARVICKNCGSNIDDNDEIEGRCPYCGSQQLEIFR